MTGPCISKRAHRILGARMPAYVDAHHARRDRAFDPETRPDGYIGLCVAESELMWDMLEPVLSAERELSVSVTGYDNMAGSVALRSAVAAILGDRLFGRPVDPDDVVMMAGVGAVLEAVFHVLADPGDGVLVPTPSYAGFWPDIEGRDELHIVPVGRDPAGGFALDIDQLDRAYENSDVTIRALLYTNPDNPLGRVASASEVAAVTAWCRERGIHLVSDEIYALSVYGDTEFVSAGREALGDDIHVVWGFSKDFGMSGLRVGAAVTGNDDVRHALQTIAVWSSVSTLTQAVLVPSFSDTSWVDRFVAVNRSRLADRYRSLSDALDAAGLAHVPSDAGFFTMLDLRRHLAEPTWDAEEELWNQMLDVGVNLTPGSACRSPVPGFFRLCFASVPGEAIPVAIDRIASAVNRRR